MEINPSSTIKLLTHVPLDNRYENTLWWDSRQAQLDYFNSKVKSGCIFSNQMYQRSGKNTLRIHKRLEDVYDCNYLMFLNEAYENKWFFAFITSVDWINNEVTQISYELDLMQTWFWNYTLGQSFVEREHTSTDNMFEHTLDEGMGTGDLVVETNFNSNVDSWGCMVLCTEHFRPQDLETPDNYEVMNAVIGGVPTAGWLWKINGTREYISGALACLMSKYAQYGKQNSVIGAFLLPTFVTSVNTLTDGFQEISYRGVNYTLWYCRANTQPTLGSTTVNFEPNLTTLNGYTPKNKKLFCYPFNRLVISNNEGSLNELKFEYFTQGFYHFSEVSGGFPTPSARSTPEYYLTTQLEDNQQALYKNNFISLQLIGDSQADFIARARSYVASNVASNVYRMATKGLMGMVAPDISNPYSTALGPLDPFMGVHPQEEQATNLYNTSTEKTIGYLTGGLVLAESLPNHVITKGNSSGLSLANNTNWFTYQQKCIRKEVAETIDTYFTMYGYKTAKVKVPNRNVRPHWTYTKTVGCNIEPGVIGLPAEDMSRIGNIYDKGITFWKNADEVGDYSLDNSPT